MKSTRRLLPGSGWSVCVLALVCASTSALAWTSKDQSLTVSGFIDNTTHQRFGERAGLAKMRSRGQLEFSKLFQPTGIFSELSLHGTVRASYDAAYHLNDDTWGDGSGAAVRFTDTDGTTSGWADPASLTPGTIPPLSPTSPFLNQAVLGAGNPNDGLRILGSETYRDSDGLILAYPTRPCDIDPRGCLDGYMDEDEDDLRFPELNDHHDWLREIYLDGTIPLPNGHELNFRIGRQQVVWGRTDLFRVLDRINPVDFSIQNIYEAFEDSRIPQGILNLEYRTGPTRIFDDLNFQIVWKFEQFRPHILGQGGEPYSINDAGHLIRGLATCWQVGCTLGNLGDVNFDGLPDAVTLPSRSIGIRDVNLPGYGVDDSEIGFRLEGVFRSVGFSLNAWYYHQQLPSLHGGSAGAPGIDPFLAQVFIPGPTLQTTVFNFNPVTGETFGTGAQRPYAFAFDIEFPRVFLLGGSADFYLEPIKSVFRVEIAHTAGEEFVNTLDPRLYSESNVLRWVVGWDRPTFIRAINRRRALNISAQVFGQHILEHELLEINGVPAGMPDWENNVNITLLIQSQYFHDRLTARFLTAYDVQADALVIGPGVDWLINDNWRLLAGLNLKFGTGKNEFDDCRTCNQYPPFTGAPGTTGQRAFRTRSALLGTFRTGVIGNALDEDELQIQLRYRF